MTNFLFQQMKLDESVKERLRARGNGVCLSHSHEEAVRTGGGVLDR